MKQILFVFIIGLLVACVKEPEYAESEIEAVKQAMKNDFLSKTVRKPGGQPFKIGKPGGTINLVTNGEPKSFNIISSGDSSAKNILEPLHDYLVNYDPYKKEFTPQAAEKFEVETPESGGMIVRYYLRDNMFWTTSDGKVRVPVTADDPIFWYDEIHGDAALRTSGYAAQFVTLDDGSEARITIHKIDRLTFEFHLPKIDANPLLSTNMNFGPKYIYEKAKKERGIEGVLNVLSIDTDLKTLPSMGPMHIVEYTPGVRIVMKRNPDYWKKDEAGTVLPYYETAIYKVVGDLNAENLLFKSGQLDYTNVRHENLEEYINKENKNYTVYDGGTSLGSDYITFNQNPAKLEAKKHKWFASTQFRQAMSCLINRERIIRQIFRGLGEPAHDFFCKANPMYNEKIKLEYTYNPNHALRLLNKAGFDLGDDKKMRDAEGNLVEFDLLVNGENNIRLDIATIFADEAANLGIKINIRSMDFQKIIDMLTSTFDWDCTIMSFGSNYWPTQGSNVWPSNGRLHLWYPMQETPATEWEAEIDKLYEAGTYALDNDKAKQIWDKYQRIILEQCPLIYIAHPYSFLAVNNRWENVFFDTLNGLESDVLFLE